GNSATNPPIMMASVAVKKPRRPSGGAIGGELAADFVAGLPVGFCLSMSAPSQDRELDGPNRWELKNGRGRTSSVWRAFDYRLPAIRPSSSSPDRSNNQRGYRRTIFFGVAI